MSFPFVPLFFIPPTHFFKKIYLFYYFGCFGSSLLHGGLLFIAVHGLLLAVASLVAEHGL